jgi:class 3 adenylate cyclase
VQPIAATIAATIAVPAPESAGERRHVTVMFCDLVDSTGIAAKLDAEEWRDLVGAYLDAASSSVTEMSGKVAKKLGDGLMALFGYPVAQENDAERAVRAALAIQRSLTELNRKNEGTSKPLLAARVAIDLGPVVVDATAEIFGDVPNVAARAQALAEPGSVVVTMRGFLRARIPPVALARRPKLLARQNRRFVTLQSKSYRDSRAANRQLHFDHHRLRSRARSDPRYVPRAAWIDHTSAP